MPTNGLDIECIFQFAAMGTFMQAEQINSTSLVQFEDYLSQRKSRMKNDYQQRLAQDLSRQQWNGCFQRNVLAVLSETYEAALQHLKTLPFRSGALNADPGMSPLTGRLVSCFEGFADEFLLFAVDKHRTSCALSNFPDEHKPDDAYINQVKREIARHWRDFALGANTYFLECR